MLDFLLNLNRIFRIVNKCTILLFFFFFFYWLNLIIYDKHELLENRINFRELIIANLKTWQALISLPFWLLSNRFLRLKPIIFKALLLIGTIFLSFYMWILILLRTKGNMIGLNRWNFWLLLFFSIGLFAKCIPDLIFIIN